MTPNKLSQALQAMTPTPPTRLSADTAMQRAGTRLRRGLSLLAVAGLGLAGLVALAGVTSSPERSPAVYAEPPQTLSVDGVQFFRTGTEAFLLRPGVKPDEPLGVFVTVPQTYVPDGQCAVHYEPVIAAQNDDAVTLATWRYAPAQTESSLSCAGVGHPERSVRLDLQEPLDDRALLIAGRNGPSQVLVLSEPDGTPVLAMLAPPRPDSAQICLTGRCVTVIDPELLERSAAAVNSAVQVRPGDRCSDAGRTDNVGRTYQVQFSAAGSTGPRIEVPLGCTPLGVVGDDRRFALDSGGPDVVRIAYDQQISPGNQCLGIGGPSGGPVTKDYVGLTPEQAEQRAAATNNDVLRIAGRDGDCVGLVRDHVINRVNVYLEGNVITAAKSF